ncbi:unnamed protein product [Spirodela intermedia]|uniref:Uncharacterized protein n=2 Tax=Spirodela intermedia TaxID=51605 RepID=A0ABN7DNN8_SPIIN|nr:unnamed protein product [Spirodela intermedia]CAA2627927.1 unnamed protein product [Spirodela intermedia]CAA6667177.1 unnamed protein product [Spirodela intermedia]CAA6667183.1 unnamed protein product [Spirodela intermedia]CAA7403993.1 unnamed protein product [Spirodela intermedia]
MYELHHQNNSNLQNETNVKNLEMKSTHGGCETSFSLLKIVHRKTFAAK